MVMTIHALKNKICVFKSMHAHGSLIENTAIISGWVSQQVFLVRDHAILIIACIKLGLLLVPVGY